MHQWINTMHTYWFRQFNGIIIFSSSGNYLFFLWLFTLIDIRLMWSVRPFQFLHRFIQSEVWSIPDEKLGMRNIRSAKYYFPKKKIRNSIVECLSYKKSEKLHFIIDGAKVYWLQLKKNIKNLLFIN